MPVHLLEENLESWLDPETSGKDLQAMLAPLPDAGIEFWEVDKRVNNARNNGPELMEPKTTK